MVSLGYQKQTRTIVASPWIIAGSVFILLLAIAILAVQNYRRETAYMHRILSEKGEALIKTVEAGARTGMRGRMWGNRQIQTMLEESARLPDVQYIIIINRQGRVLAHSDSLQRGSLLDRNYDLAKLALSKETRWKLKESNDGKSSFEVYRVFNPLSRLDERARHHMRQMMKQHDAIRPPNEWNFFPQRPGRELIIIVGLDPKPFEDERKEDIRHTIIMSGILVMLGMAGFISMFWMQSYRATKKSLQDTSAFVDKVVTSLPVGLIATDKTGSVTYYNRAAERITGIDFSKENGSNIEKILPDSLYGLIDSLDRGESIFDKETTCEFTQGNLVPVGISASKIVNEEGRFVGHVLILRDLGEVRRLQEEIRRKEKLAAIGGLAAGVAHEIRNPLSSIKGIATYFKAKSEKDSEDKKAADVMIQEVERLNRAITELLEFARPTQLTIKETDVNDLLAHTVRLIQQEAVAKGIQIELDLTPQHLTADMDSDRFSQCLLNLYINALQAMKPGGRLTIKNFRTNNNSVNIEIEDTGPGITAEDIDKVFDPYYTTKTDGTGLGLAIVYKIVEAHHGKVAVRSEPGKGSIFTITIPVISEIDDM